MSITDCYWKNKSSIIQGINDGIVDALSHANKGVYRPNEPALVAALVLEGTNNIYKNIDKILNPNGYKTSITSVYCHQKPIVAYESGKNCELGDILFVYCHSNKRGDVYRNSMLFQAKKIKKAEFKINKNDMHQLKLYMEWPDFEYVKGVGFSNIKQKRCVKPKSYHAGAKYLLFIEKYFSCLKKIHDSSNYNIQCAMPNDNLFPHSSFSFELFYFFLFLTGRPFCSKNDAIQENGWSRVIWDLIEPCMKYKFNLKKYKRLNENRVNKIGDVELFCSSSYGWNDKTMSSFVKNDGFMYVLDNSDSNPPNDESYNYSEDYVGFPVVIIETHED